MAAVIDKKCVPIDPRHAKEWKTNPLINRDKSIEQDHGKQNRINEGHAQPAAPLGGERITEQAFLEFFLLRQHFLFEANFVLFKISLPLLTSQLGLLFNGGF